MYCSSASPNTPSSLGPRFSLVNDSEGWFCIKEVSGEVHTAQSLQGAKPGDTYTVLVEAQDTGMIKQQWGLLRGLLGNFIGKPPFKFTIQNIP